MGFFWGAGRIASLAIVYLGAFSVLWSLGLAVRGWRGWALWATPLVGLVLLRLWAWRRVAVEVAGGTLRYEGAVPSRDFEVELDQLEAIYFDGALPDRPLVLVLRDGDERVCGELSAKAAQGLYAYLVAAGISEVRPVGASP